jgi:RNA polymerase primary sigma factor
MRHQRDEGVIPFRTIDPLTRERECELIVLAQAGDNEAACTIVRANVRFVKTIAAKYTSCGLTTDELISEGLMGIHEAILRFDGTRGFKFISYAVWWIRQRMLAAIQTQGRNILLPINQTQQILKLKRHQTALGQRLGRRVSRRETIDDLLASGESLSLGPGQTQYDATPMSLDQPVLPENWDHGDTAQMQLADPEAEVRIDAELLSGERLQVIIEAMAVLTLRERKVLQMYYGFDGTPMTLERIGVVLGVTRERVRQLKEQALGKMRRQQHLASTLRN